MILVDDTVDSLAAQYNLRYNEQKWLTATVNLLVDDSQALKQFLAGDVRVFDRTQFNQLGGLSALVDFQHRDEVFATLRNCPVVRQSFAALSQ